MTKKIWPILLLAAVSSSAAAEWVEIASNQDFTAYVDPVSIRKTGDRVKMWELIDLKAVKVSAAGKDYRSSKTQSEYDCKAGQWRFFFFSDHSGHMGEGEVVYRDADPCTWGPVVLGTISEALWRFACGVVVAG